MTRDNPAGRYTLLRELGRGAIGAVSAARDRSTGATLALKTLDPALLGAADSKLAGLFLENARSAARLRHQNIVKVHDAGEAGGTAYVAMDLVEGESLRRLLDHRPLPIARAVQIFDDIASALAYAHEEGMVHRGVRPSSILVARSGVAKIGDFGFGQIGEAALPYMSPEQVRGNPVDARSDLFSLGAVFYEMLTGRAPFAGSSPKEIRDSILRAKPPRASEMNPHVPEALDGLVSKLLAGNPDDRFASARLVLRDLQRLEEALGLRPGVSPATSEPKPSPRPAAPEPKPQAPDPIRQRKSEPTLQTPAFALHDQGGGPSGPILRTDPSHLKEFQPQHRQISSFPTFDEHDERLMRHRGPAPERRSGASTALAALALVVAVASIAVTVVVNDYPGLGALRSLITRNQASPPTPSAPATAAVPPPSAPATAAAPPPQAAPMPVAETIKPPVPVAQPIPSAATEASPAPAPAQTAAVGTLPPRPAPPAAKPTANVTQPQPAGTAKLIVAISPRGDVYIDGEHRGTAPPVKTLDLEPGMHRIEIRSGSRRPYLTYMVVEPGDQRRVRYDFNARGRPPV